MVHWRERKHFYIISNFNSPLSMNSLKTYLVLLKRCLICQKSIAVILANNDNLTFCLQTRLIIPNDLVKNLIWRKWTELCRRVLNRLYFHFFFYRRSLLNLSCVNDWLKIATTFCIIIANNKIEHIHTTQPLSYNFD